MNTLGTSFRITSIGESHGKIVGVVIDGCPAGLELDMDKLQKDLDRRRPGQSKVSTTRNEADRAEVLTGLYEGVTTGAPITIIIRNQDRDSSKYLEARWTPALDTRTTRLASGTVRTKTPGEGDGSLVGTPPDS